MTAESKAAVLTARRAAQHIRPFKPNDAYEYLCILTVLPEPSPISALCWQIHRRLTVLVPLLRVWVHCPRASNGLLPRRSNLVGYVRWDARSDQSSLYRQSIQQLYRSQPPGIFLRHPHHQPLGFLVNSGTTYTKERLAVLVDGLYGEGWTTVRIDQDAQQGPREEDLEETRSRDRAGAFSGRLARRANDLRRTMRRVLALAQLYAFSEKSGKPPDFQQASAGLLWGPQVDGD